MAGDSSISKLDTMSLIARHRSFEAVRTDQMAEVQASSRNAWAFARRPRRLPVIRFLRRRRRHGPAAARAMPRSEKAPARTKIE